ncbi:MotA/TolQ/ExbB proton channel family protein [Fontisphaera persica]|uniref:MotA/TolQ/ExbB proton channel family protein n=1 Tax=Fontisphaera persica TaxID=2974023 RepID=UPI0024C0E0E7|nr:MotA/TolQ/ExbB proton channel family protein [Fontisphaera persica]WCJ58167.1 MotA/TolQ/ExbB proton channel family protein [Fontisphaera persica]
MIELFLKGGPLMWPLLLASTVALATTFERLWFLWQERRRRQPEVVQMIWRLVEHGEADQAVQAADGTTDFVARTLASAIRHRGEFFTSALLRAAQFELRRYSRGLVVLDTLITLAPLLGLLGTVTGMIQAFNLVGGKEIEAPAAITGGIAEALIATAFGLAIAILALIPYNYLNARLEEARHELEDAANRLELSLSRHNRNATSLNVEP